MKLTKNDWFGAGRWVGLTGKLGVALGLLLLGSVTAFAVLGTRVIGRPLRAVTDQAKRTADGERGAMTPMSQSASRPSSQPMRARAPGTMSLTR